MNLSKSFLLLILCISIYLNCYSVDLTPVNFRQDFQHAIEDEKLCLEFIKRLESVDDEDFIYRAYRAAAVMSLAKFTSFPTDKLKYYQRGKEELELAIQEIPESIELRFLRLAVQDFIPGILLYNDQEEDLRFILNKLNSVDDDLYKKEVKNYLIHMGHCNQNDFPIRASLK